MLPNVHRSDWPPLSGPGGMVA